MLNWRDMKNPAAGGAEAVAENVVNGLAELGHEIVYLTSAFPGSKREEDLGKAKVIRRGSVFTVYIHAFLYFMKHRKDFDFVIECVSAVPFFTPLYFNSKKVIIMPYHIVGKVIFKELNLPSALIAYAAERSIPTLYKKSKFLAISNEVRTELINFGVNGNNIEVCYFGPNYSFKPVKLGKYDIPTIVTATRLMKYKRVNILLDVFKKLVGRSGTRMIVIGRGKEMDSLKRYADKLEIGSRVSFEGWVSEDEKAEMLAKSWIFVTASEREGFGISALEAEMSGTPVVAFAVGGLKEAVKDGYSGILLREGDIDGFARGVDRLLSDDELRKSMSKNGIEYGKRFDPNKAIRTIDKMVRSASKK